MKLMKIKDDWGELRGYKYGNHYLMKIYTWGNTYSWCINKTGDYHYSNFEMGELEESGEIEWVSSFKDGKSRLQELNA